MTKEDDGGVALTSKRTVWRCAPRVLAGVFSPWLARQMRAASAIGILITVAACGGGGGGGQAPVTQAPPTVLGVSGPRASQGGIGEGEAGLAFRVALDGATVSFPVTVGFNTSSTALANPDSARIGTSCSAGVDYYIPVVADLTVTANTTSNTSSGQLTIPSAAASRKINVMVCPTNSAADKIITLAWSGGGSSGTATGTILGKANANLAGSDRLNDTGITTCADGAFNGLACPQAAFPGQDAESGRDATPTLTGTGSARTSAFVFTSLTIGSVIQDNVTGLMWEAKTTDNGLHDVNATFTWFNSTAGTNGGAAGTAAGGACAGVPAGCDTEKFVAAVNAEALGGFSDWRLPTAQELSTLVDNGAAAGPTVDATLPNQAAAEYWSASPRSQDNTGAWIVDFNSGAIASIAKSLPRRVRLVRGR